MKNFKKDTNDHSFPVVCSILIQFWRFCSLGICPFILGCQICWHTIVCNPMWFFFFNLCGISCLILCLLFCFLFYSSTHFLLLGEPRQRFMILFAFGKKPNKPVSFYLFPCFVYVYLHLNITDFFSIFCSFLPSTVSGLCLIFFSLIPLGSKLGCLLPVSWGRHVLLSTFLLELLCYHRF